MRLGSGEGATVSGPAGDPGGNVSLRQTTRMGVFIQQRLSFSGRGCPWGCQPPVQNGGTPRSHGSTEIQKLWRLWNFLNSGIGKEMLAAHNSFCYTDLGQVSWGE